MLSTIVIDKYGLSVYDVGIESVFFLRSLMIKEDRACVDVSLNLEWFRQG